LIVLSFEKRRRNSIIIQSKDTGQVRAEQKKKQNRIILYTLIATVCLAGVLLWRVWTFLLSAHNREALSCAGNEMLLIKRVYARLFISIGHPRSKYGSSLFNLGDHAALPLRRRRQHHQTCRYIISALHTQNTTVLRCDARGDH
jgi:hypothetical protein